MTNFYDTERLFAFTISVIVGVSGKLAYDSASQKITFATIIRAFGLGFFVGFVLDNLLFLLERESWRFVLVPFGVYSSTYVLQTWHNNNNSVLVHLLQFFLGKLKTNDNTNIKNNESEDNSEPEGDIEKQ